FFSTYPATTEIYTLSLHDALPIFPTTETSLEDILKFKDKRKDELLEFRYLMDTFYLEIIKSGDSESAMIASVDRIQKKISDIDRDRKSTRLNSSHVSISYAVFCLK